MVYETSTTNEVRTGKWMRAAQKGLKMAIFIDLGTTTGLGSFLGNHGCDPFLSQLWSQTGPFSRPFRPGEGRKLVSKGSKLDNSTCLCNPNSTKLYLQKHIF